jgi:hypothetical protein
MQWNDIFLTPTEIENAGAGILAVWLWENIENSVLWQT